MTLSDEISHSFFVLDEDRTGYLTLEQVYLIYIGLGYDPSVSQQELAVHVPQNRHDKVTLQDVQRILRFVSLRSKTQG
jgi:Ca2+-binding EF-hand superfamily protein